MICSRCSADVDLLCEQCESTPEECECRNPVIVCEDCFEVEEEELCEYCDQLIDDCTCDDDDVEGMIEEEEDE